MERPCVLRYAIVSGMTSCWPGPSVVATDPLPAPERVDAAVYANWTSAVSVPRFARVSSVEKLAPPSPAASSTIGTRRGTGKKGPETLTTAVAPEVPPGPARMSVYLVPCAGLTATDPLVGTGPTPLSMLADVAPTVVQRSVLDCPGATSTGVAVKEAISAGARGTIGTETGAVRVRPPPDAVMVAAQVPGVADTEDARVRVALPLPGAGTLCGTKVPVTPVGRPLTERPTAALKPPVPVVVTRSEERRA